MPKGHTSKPCSFFVVIFYFFVYAYKQKCIREPKYRWQFALLQNGNKPKARLAFFIVAFGNNANPTEIAFGIVVAGCNNKPVATANHSNRKTFAIVSQLQLQTICSDKTFATTNQPKPSSASL